MIAPTLHTERLCLRSANANDFDQFVHFYTSDRAKYAGGIKTQREAWNILAAQFGHWQLRGFGMFVIAEKKSDKAIGIVGPYFPHGWPEKEIGWVLFDAAHEGQGYAFEAAQACIDYAWCKLKWDTIVSYIHQDNLSSIALAERLGAKLDPNAAQPKPEEPCLVYRHPRPKDLS